MQQEEKDLEFERGVLTRKMNSGEDVVIDTDRAAVLRNVGYPRAEFHFLVLPKEDIGNVTELRNAHLPLLDHMMDLANEIIEQQHLHPSHFRVGFKISPFMSRLNMHVISDDFYSDRMRRIQHWNTFNTELFLPFQAVYALLRVHGSVQPMPDDVVEKLRITTPVHCNQCSFITHNFRKFKDHLEFHWRRRERERLFKTGVENLSQMMGSLHMNSHMATMRPPFNYSHNMPPPYRSQFLQHARGPVGQQPRFQRANQAVWHFRFPNNNSLNNKQPGPFAPKPTSNGSQQTKANDEIAVATNKNGEQQQVLEPAPHQPSNEKQPFVKKKWYNKEKKPQTQPESHTSKAAGDA